MKIEKCDEDVIRQIERRNPLGDCNSLDLYDCFKQLGIIVEKEKVEMLEKIIWDWKEPSISECCHWYRVHCINPSCTKMIIKLIGAEYSWCGGPACLLSCVQVTL